MTTVLCQHPIKNQQKALLCNEFPRCRFIFSRENNHTALLPGHLKLAEVFFGDDLTPAQLEEAPHLRWVQSPHHDLRKLPVNEMAEREDILITAAPPAEIRQTGEFVMATMLSIAKGLPAWCFLGQTEHEKIWTSHLAEQMWTLEKRIFLQVGLGDVGTEIVRCAGQFGMRIRAVHHNRSYNPYVERTLSDSELHSVLPAADVVSVSLPYAWRYHHSFGKDEFSLMKEGAILIVTGAGGVVDEEALLPFVKAGKFRGVVLDAVENPPLPSSSPWWDLHKVMITPGVASCPRESSVQPFRVLRRNLRHYLPGNYGEMRGKVDIDLWNRSGVSGRKTF